MFVILRVVFVIAVLSAIIVTAKEHRILPKEDSNPSGTTEHITASAQKIGIADSESEATIVESKAEAIVCLVMVVLAFGGSQCYCMFGAGVRKVDKMGYVVKRQEEFASFMSQTRKAPSASSKHKMTKTTKAMHVAAREYEARSLDEKNEQKETLYKECKALNVDGIEHTLREMERRFGTLFMSDYSLAVAHLGKAGEADKAKKWLRRAVEVGLVPMPSTFNAVINAYVKLGNSEQALNLAWYMKRVGVQFDTITYNTIIEAWARAGDASSCQLWMKKMLAAGVEPSVITFGSVMRACAGAGLAAEVEDWYVLSQKLDIELNLISFSSVANAFARKDDLPNAMKWLTRCIESGIQPNVQCFMGVLNSHLNRGDFDLAAKLIDCMRGADVEPDSCVFGQCIVFASKTGQLKRAQNWADECVACNCKLTKAAEAALIDAQLRVPILNKKRNERPGAAPATGERRTKCFG